MGGSLSLAIKKTGLKIKTTGVLRSQKSYDEIINKNLTDYLLIEEDFLRNNRWNEYDLNSDVALMLTRMYTMPKFRMNYHIAKNILPLALEEAKAYPNIWFTCNEYNKKIYDWFVRVEQGKAGALFNDWPDIYRNFKPIGKQNIYYTEQYVIEYKK
jgi:hypothetical protein